MEELSPEEKTNIVRGHRATITNPDVSKGANRRSEQIIKELGDVHYGQEANNNKDEKNVIRGYKRATLHNVGVSEEAKRHAQQMLEEMDAA